jgi:hypothetical protein
MTYNTLNLNGHTQHLIQPFAFADNEIENWRMLTNKEIHVFKNPTIIERVRLG